MGSGEVGNSTIGEQEEEERSMKNREKCWLGREAGEAVPEAGGFRERRELSSARNVATGFSGKGVDGARRRQTVGGQQAESVPRGGLEAASADGFSLKSR